MPFKARSNDQNKIIVVGIAKTLDDAAFSDMFGLYGTVAEAKVVRSATGESRGFGFVTYTSAAAKNKAIKHMNQTTVDGRILNVRDVIPKADRDPEAAKKVDKPKTGVCWAFQKGLCDKGDACKYPHEVKDGDYGSCFEFAQQGKCKRGDACKFAHGTKEKAADKFASDDEDDDKEEVVAPTKAEVDPTKPRVCFAFQNGKCHRGKACMFLHELIASEPKEAEPKAAETKKRKREDASPEDELAALIAAEDDALLKYEQAKSARQAKEAELAAVAKTAKPSKDTSKPAKAAPTKVMKVDDKAKTKDMATKVPAAKDTAVKKTIKPAATTKEASKPPAKKAVATKAEKVDMGAAFDSSDEDKPKAKKVKTGAPRLLASDHRKLRQEKKKAALALLKSKKQIEVPTSD
ncbi:zinc finger CCCH domain-containing protein 25-like [Achlya hypogyna]|uniref:Zinc finger CCCH domain-containing protein 25-like n=1 Tax=Achlya hypogyna TaxID=1202772 RepID=A0A1V9Z0S1_ACHHY|nr:zinc finger CCCH domain-containing protein 25-like [Achlya hypogyna]